MKWQKELKPAEIKQHDPLHDTGHPSHSNSVLMTGHSCAFGTAVCTLHEKFSPPPPFWTPLSASICTPSIHIQLGVRRHSFLMVYIVP